MSRSETVWIVDDDHAGFGEEFQAHVAASFGPFVGLFGQDSADEAG